MGGQKMAQSWAALEAHVRATAKLIWDRDAAPENIAGVDIDAVLKIAPICGY